jgi:hypothetical protein
VKRLKFCRELDSIKKEQIHELWNQEYPLNLKDRFSILLSDTQDHRHFVIENDLGEIIAWAVDFLSQEERRFSIIVSSKEKCKGLGALLINKLKEENDVFFGWVIDHNRDLKSNGENYQTPLPFYLKHGFEILTEQRLETEIISAVKICWKRG